MSNDTTHSIDDLFVEETSDTNNGSDAGSKDAAGSTSKDGSQGQSRTGSDSKQTNLDDLTPAEAARKTFVEAWANKIHLGKATLEELGSKQAWLVPGVQERLAELNTNRQSVPDPTEAARKVFAEERAKDNAKAVEVRFNEIKERIKNSSPTPAQMSRLKERFDALVGRLDPDEALRTAAEIAQIDFDGIATARSAAALPKMGYAPVGDTSDDIMSLDPNKMTREERVAFLTKYPGRR